MMSSLTAGTTSERKKRTRPVSACEYCRSKKVKCHLLPDKPVCKGCAQAGKQCLFRIDDLSPALRRERFAEYGLPDEDHDPAKSRARRRRKHGSISESTVDVANDSSLPAPSKSKAIFRSFANPTKLAAPSSSATTDTGEGKGGAYNRSAEGEREPAPRSASLRDTADVHDVRYGPSASYRHSYAIARNGNANGPPFTHNAQAQRHVSLAHTDQRPSWNRYGGDEYCARDHEPQRNSTPTSQMRQYSDIQPHIDTLQHPAMLDAYQRRPYRNTIANSNHLVDLQPPRTYDSGSRSHSSRIDALATSAQGVLPNFIDNTDTGVYDNAAPDTRQFHHDARYIDGIASRPAALQLPSDIVKTTQPSASALSESQRQSSGSGIDLSLGVERNDLAAANRYDERQSSADNVRASTHMQNSSMSQTGQLSTGEKTASPGSNKTTSKPPATFKKIALPFFRWFGATANTPGIRRIKVGVYHDSDIDLVTDGAADFASARVDFTPGKADSPVSAPAVSPAGELDSNRRSQSFVSPPHIMSSPGVTGPPTVQPHVHGEPSALSTSARELFESSRPRYPRGDLLVHLVGIFLKYFKASCFPWLDDEELMASARSGELPAILANAICSVAARFSGHQDLQRAKNSSESFADMAKTLIVPMLSWPSIDVIEALVILSYAEFGAGADAGLWMYIGMALRMATDLGLQHELTIQSLATKKQQERARYLFWAIVCLDRITCFGTGRPLTIRDDAYDCQLPPLEQDTSSDAFVFGHIVRTLLKRGQIGELLNRKDEDMAFEQRSAQLRILWLDLAKYYETLPDDVQFGVNTFRKHAAADKGSAFVYLHVLLQSTISLLNRPSLLRRFDKDFMISAPSSLASIANHASGTIVSILRFAMDAGHHRSRSTEEHDDVNPYIDCNPYLDQLILPAGRAFLTERESAKETLRRFGHQGPLSRPRTRDGPLKDAEAKDNLSTSINDELFDGLNTRRQYAQTNIGTCQEVLTRIARWWNGAQWPARALRQESEGATEDDVGPDGPDEEAQPAPIRDVEMVLRWARARRIRARRVSPAGSRRASNASADHADAASLGRRTDQVAADPSGDVLSNAHGGTGAYDLSSLWHGGNDASPLGLGFSGSLGAASEVDIDALIHAWARELGTIGSTSAVQGDIGTPNGLSRNVSSRAIVRKPPSAPALTDLFGRDPTTEHTYSSMDPQPWPNDAHKAFDIDLSAMHLEEFFFDTDPTIQADGTLFGTFATSLYDAMVQNEVASPMYAASNDLAGMPKEEAPLTRVDGAGQAIAYHNLDVLPAALLNTLSFHPSRGTLLASTSSSHQGQGSASSL